MRATYAQHEWIDEAYRYDVQWSRCALCGTRRAKELFCRTVYYTPDGDYTWSPNTMLVDDQGKARDRCHYRPHEIEPSCVRLAG